MKLTLLDRFGILLAILLLFFSCTGDYEQAEGYSSPEFMVPHTISTEGHAETDGDQIYVNDYSNALHGIFMVAGNSRSSEYGHENYRPELFPDEMNARAERWLDLMHATDQFFNENGQFVNRYIVSEEGYRSSEEVDLSIYPHLVYSYHMHHRGSRFDDHALYERLSRETANFIVMPGQYLLNNHFEEGRFINADGTTDHRSMSYGLGGIHGHGYAWIVWQKPEGEDNMGLLTEEALGMWLGFGIDDMLAIYRQTAGVLEEAWADEISAYDFGNGTIWNLDALGAMLRGKKTMYDFLYMFGDDSDKEIARTVFYRTANMFDAVIGLIEPWGLPSEIDFTPDGTSAASAEVAIYDWYQFLNHIGGGFAFDREREGTSEFINRYREDLKDLLPEIYDQAMLGILDYHMSENNTVVNVVSYEDGSVLDDRLTVSTLGMFLTVTGNIYTNGEEFARADGWNSVSDEVADRSRNLYDIKFKHIDLLEGAIFNQ